MNGYTGKILRLNLTAGKISIINTEKYQQWGGGHGMGSAIFWDLVKNKAISGFDPANIVTIMTSPLSGTLVPGASARTEVQGIGVQSSPVEWFTRSNFGGRFAPMLKYAGWDGIVVEGKADKPVWIDIRNDKVRIKDAGHLWGLDTWQTQEKIWAEVMEGQAFGDWMTVGGKDSEARTTQKPAVLTIGPAGENLGRIACLIHDVANASGQGGFGGVWGSKNLKAISVIGTGSIKVADPNALMESRIWANNEYAFNVDQQRGKERPLNYFWKGDKNARIHACVGCHAGCQERNSSGMGTDSTCLETAFYTWADKRKHWRQTNASYIATDLLQKQGVNAYETTRGLPYILALAKKGVLGPGRKIDCDLDFSSLGTVEFAEKFVGMISNREGIGDDMAEGFYRAAQRWGRLEQDLKTGLLLYPYWGLPEHGYDPRSQVCWGYSTILGDRDCNEHEFTLLFWYAKSFKDRGKEVPVPAESVVNAFSSKLLPFQGDPLMLDYSDENIYSDHMIKLVAWQRRYTRFWKQSVLYCDHRWPQFVSGRTKDYLGCTSEGEQRFFNDVTGNNYSFVDGMEVGRKIWNLDNAIWTLQGRHRDMVHFSDYIYNVKEPSPIGSRSYYLPGRKNGKWDWLLVSYRCHDRDKFDDFKTRYYNFEGWDSKTGWPKRSTLQSLDLSYVADELAAHGRLGS
jgi:aldehyde:ferredoxin oxidoreductase